VLDRLPEARPTGAGVELGAGVEQGLAAADATVDAGVLRIPVGPTEGPLGGLPPGYPKLLGAQCLTPLRLTLLDTPVHRNTNPFLDSAPVPSASYAKAACDQGEPKCQPHQISLRQHAVFPFPNHSVRSSPGRRSTPAARQERDSAPVA